ncbi:MAG: hypothetical protein ACJ73S_24115 [Mycobacteriales bacterium]
MTDPKLEAALKSALDLHQAEAPEGAGLVDRAVAAGIGRRRRRRVVVVAAAAVALLAAVGIPVTLRDRGGDGGPPVLGGSGTGLETTVRVVPPPGGRKLTARIADPGREQLTYGTGGFQITVIVLGKDGGEPPGGTGDPVTLPSGRKAYVMGGTDSDTRAVKAHLREGFHDPVTVPFRLSYLPAGYDIAEAGTGIPATGVPVSLSADGPGGGSIQVSWDVTSGAGCGGSRAPVTVDGHAGSECAGIVSVPHYHGRTLMVSFVGDVPNASLVLAGLRWAG